MNRNLPLIVICGFSALVMVSCKEQYKQIDVSAFNLKIEHNTDISTAKDLILAYDVKLNDRNESLSIDSECISRNHILITAVVNIHDDDALASEKIVMNVERKGNHWKASEIRYNWKNRKGYGHTVWGI